MKKVDDRSLQRLAPLEYSPEGKPRVLVPDEVFHRGAVLHREYIVGSFLGKMPAYGPIQSVLNYLWGKGKKLEIHLNPWKRSILVRIPNDYIRQKVLEKKLWYVETSMFHVSQWNAELAASAPEIVSIPLWAHLRGIPFDLRTRIGLSLAAGLVGEPKETDEFTKNLINLDVAHVYVEVNLKKPLPSSVELIRENGEIIPIDVEYPWIPPSCSHCKEIGHIIKNCLNMPFKVPASTNDAKGSHLNVVDPAVDVTSSPVSEASVVVESPSVVEVPASKAKIPLAVVTSETPSVAMDPVTLLPEVVGVTKVNMITLLPEVVNPSEKVILAGETVESAAFAPQESSTDVTLNLVPNLSIPSSALPLPTSSQKSNSPSEKSEKDTDTLSFSSSPSKASFVIGLPATLPPSFGSYITTHQAALFKSSSLPSSFVLPFIPPLNELASPFPPSSTQTNPFVPLKTPIPPVVNHPVADTVLHSLPLEGCLLSQGVLPRSSI